MLFNSPKPGKQEFLDATGWELKPEGACKGTVCIPYQHSDADTVDLVSVSTALNMPLVQDSQFGLWALGPESGNSRALSSAKAPEMRLPDINGNEFCLSSLKGQKIIVYAWAPY